MEEINQLKRNGLSILAISNLTGYDRKTIRKYLLEPTATEARAAVESESARSARPSDDDHAGHPTERGG